MGDTANPPDARILHRHCPIKSLGDGVANEGGAFLLKQLDQPFLLGDQGIDLVRLLLEEHRDALLLLNGWKREHRIRNRTGSKSESCDPIGSYSKLIQHSRGSEGAEQILARDSFSPWSQQSQMIATKNTRKVGGDVSRYGDVHPCFGILRHDDITCFQGERCDLGRHGRSLHEVEAVRDVVVLVYVYVVAEANWFLAFDGFLIHVTGSHGGNMLEPHHRPVAGICTPVDRPESLYAGYRFHFRTLPLKFVEVIIPSPPAASPRCPSPSPGCPPRCVPVHAAAGTGRSSG